MRREFQQRIVSRLLRRKRIGQRRGHLLRCREMPERALHLLRDCRRYRRGFRLLNFFRELLRHAKRFLLRILHHRLVLQIFFARRSRSRVVLRAFQIPRRGDDLLLQLRKLRRLTAPTAPTDTWRRLAAGTVVAGPVDFLEWPHLREENVALRTARLSVRSGVLGPHMPRHQLVHFHADLLELKHMLQVQFFVRLRIARERDLLRLAAADGIADARRTQPEVIPRIHTERDLLDLRHTLVALRCHDLQFGPAVRQRIEGKCRGEFVCTTVGVLEFQLPHRALADWKILQLHHSLCSIHTQRHHASVLRDELCGLHRFVELKRHIKRRPLHRAHTSRVRDQLFRQLRKLRETHARICTIQPRVLEDLHREFPRRTSRIFHAIRKVARHLRHAAAENRVIEIFHQRDALRRSILRTEQERRLARHVASKFRQNHEPRATFQFHIARRNGHFLLRPVRDGPRRIFR